MVITHILLFFISYQSVPLTFVSHLDNEELRSAVAWGSSNAGQSQQDSVVGGRQVAKQRRATVTLYNCEI